MKKRHIEIPSLIRATLLLMCIAINDWYRVIPTHGNKIAPLIHLLTLQKLHFTHVYKRAR